MTTTQTTQWNLIRIMLCSTLAATIYSSCPKPPSLTYAVPNAENENYNEGDTVNYSCLAGYKSIPSISNIATCDADGNWSKFSEAFCLKLDCHIPDFLQNGKVEFLDTVIGSSASYKCVQGYKLFGSDTRYCLADEKWNGTVPTCNRTCPNPPNLKYAVINTTTSQIADYHPLSAQVVYSCISGFIPNFFMPSSSTCQSDFTWSKIIEFCRRVSCGSPGEVENGVVEMVDDMFQSKAFFSCNSGYMLVGNPYRECLEEGIWSGSIPTCQRSCPDPPVPKYAQIIEMPDTQYFPVQIIIVYRCLPGYKYDPFISPIIQCLEGYAWSNINEFCKKVICGEPERIKNGNILITGTDFGSIAIYSCSKGYNLTGNSVRKCTADSVWGGSPPACQAI
ncbi:zona pellucida sperm-binding protein 3 receptor-like isoform 1-T2 [Anomaloglossus baeobatrachus]|uniref:zona pellucida sperm-binding protein 3 receptor-like isoform X1 n=1 Tax=Anomaloglossus baeobatrachus TaxID=238106 RepID=UPI003F5081C7